MSFNKKISVLILAISLAVIGWIVWDKFLNKGIISINGPAPFSVKIDGANFPCTTEICETKFAPGEYDLLIQKDGYVDISQKITLHRAEKLVINAKLKKQMDFIEFGSQQAKYVKVLGADLPLEISVSDGLRKEYDKLFEIVRGIKSPKNIILRKMNNGSSVSAIVYTSDSDRTYFAAPDQKNLVNFGKKLNGPAAIIPTKPAVVFLDSKSHKNQALMIWDIGSTAPAVVTYFQIPISGDIITVSDNGKFVFVLDKDSRGNNKIYKIDIENKSKELVFEGGEISRIVPSPDGKFIVLELADDPNYDAFIHGTEAGTPGKIAVDKKYRALLHLYSWTSDNEIVFVYKESETAAAGFGESSAQSFPRVIEYNPLDESVRVIQDLKDAATMPSKIDYAEAGGYRRVMMLIGNKIYNLDYLAK